MEIPSIKTMFSQEELAAYDELDAKRREATSELERNRLSKHAGLSEKTLAGRDKKSFVSWHWFAKNIEMVARGLEQRDDDIAALQERIAELERKAGPQLKYLGIWAPGEYQRGNMITFRGSIWHCDRATTSQPDAADRAWTLACRAGRDGRAK